MSNRVVARMAVAVCAWLLSADFAAAYYNPATGRFLSRDPIDEQGAMVVATRRQPTPFLPRDRNTYAFTRNRPTDRVDILGLQTANPKAGLPHCRLNGQLVTLSFDGSISPW